MTENQAHKLERRKGSFEPLFYIQPGTFEP